ncbi:MAG TPA: DUF488 family protein [Candidatus Corynebacterium faecigallinarum]|uniref:DUF488 family protein n=1 Tax=Candidatus Corynebacterium faecigallinarum TaxID=2838528 RepID=A0A9D2TNT7_9CORY|nr:DUF488 family protein [Candidatus Corynebacterium faecigallinarum]
MGTLKIARVYDVHAGCTDSASSTDSVGSAGHYLVDRLWPRGVKKEDLPLTGWPKELTPSPQLRTDFHHGALDWDQFGDAYRAELDERHKAGELDDILAELADTLADRDVLLLFAGKDTEHTHARVLQEWVESVLSRD